MLQHRVLYLIAIVVVAAALIAVALYDFQHLTWLVLPALLLLALIPLKRR